MHLRGAYVAIGVALDYTIVWLAILTAELCFHVMHTIYYVVCSLLARDSSSEATRPNLMISKDTRVICQGFTGRQVGGTVLRVARRQNIKCEGVHY